MRREALHAALSSWEALRDRGELAVSFDWNCPKYITPRFTAAEVEEATAPLRQRIAELEARLGAGT